MAAASPAGAGPPDGHFSFDFNGSEEIVCGMTTSREGSIHGAFHEHRGRDGAMLGALNEHWSIRYTNVATGRWLLAEFNGNSKDLQIIDEGDGIITIVVLVTGIDRVSAPDGTLVYQGTGMDRREIRIDLMDPEDPVDDVLLSDDLVKRAGRYVGAADCDALLALMG
jgi:hypothetical protein